MSDVFVLFDSEFRVVYCNEAELTLIRLDLHVRGAAGALRQRSERFVPEH